MVNDKISFFYDFNFPIAQPEGWHFLDIYKTVIVEEIKKNRGYLRVLLLSKLKKKTIFKYLKKNYFIYNYNFFHTLLTIF